MTPLVRFGLDRLCDSSALLGDARRAGLVTNNAARLAHDVSRHSRVALMDAGVPLVRLFGPEHGLSATNADGAAVPDDIDTLTGLEVVSLYGERMRPHVDSLRDLDVMLFDVPDVGARFYTYTWTLFHLLAACADARVPLVVLDRPNPLGGDLGMCEGPMLDPVHRSFVGEDAIPIRHQLTLGELARLWQRERFPAAALRVVTCEGWRREMRWNDLGLPWVPTSPSMPAFASALLYPGTCLFEATNLSVGRGTAMPFQVVGAPWLDSARLLRMLRTQQLPAVQLERVTFTPAMAPFAGVECHGLRVVATDVGAIRPVSIGLALLAAVVRSAHREFSWSRYPTAANPSGEGHFERLIGQSAVRVVVMDQSQTVDAALVQEWTRTPGWSERVRSALLYEDTRVRLAKP